MFDDDQPNPFTLWMNMTWGMPLQLMSEWAKYNEQWLTMMQPLNSGDITIYYPFGQGYVQRIDPDTNWGFIWGSRTDHAALEQEIVRDVASYGMQIGRMMELLLNVAEQFAKTDPEMLSAVQDLKTRIDGAKAKYDL